MTVSSFLDKSLVWMSIEEQNKYLFDYIHKLEYLVLQSQKERANTSAKFTKILDHIKHGLGKLNKINSKVHEALKKISVMKCEDLSDIPEKQPASSEPDDKDFLYETLGTGSKPIENLEVGFAVNFEPRIRQVNHEDKFARGNNINSNDNRNHQLLRNEFTISKQEANGEPNNFEKEFQLDKRFISLWNGEEDLSKSLHKETSTTSKADEPTSNFMKIQWQLVPYLIKEGVEK